MKLIRYIAINNLQKDACKTARESTKQKDALLSPTPAIQQNTNEKANRISNPTISRGITSAKSDKHQTAPNSARDSLTVKTEKGALQKAKRQAQPTKVDQRRKEEPIHKVQVTAEKLQKAHQIQIQASTNINIIKPSCKTERQNSNEPLNSKRGNSHSFADVGLSSRSKKSTLTQPKPTSKEKPHQPSLSAKPKKEFPEETPKEIAFPLTPAQALQYFGHKLNDTEKDEIANCGEIYFFGRENSKKQRKKLNVTDSSQSYDDDKGDYLVNTGDQIGYRYEILDIIDTGSFGEAIKCYDHKAKQEVALKVIRSKKRFYYQATVEVKILKYIQEHDTNDLSNIVKIFDYFIFRKHIVWYLQLIYSVYPANYSAAIYIN